MFFGYADMHALLSEFLCGGSDSVDSCPTAPLCGGTGSVDDCVERTAMSIEIVAQTGLSLSNCVRLTGGQGDDVNLVKTLVGGQGVADRDNLMTPVRIIAADIVLATNRWSLHRVHYCGNGDESDEDVQGVHAVRICAFHTESGSRSSAADHSLFFGDAGGMIPTML